jgi:hypothetical protein
VIGVLVALMLAAVAPARERARVVAVLAELRQAGTALETYMIENGGRCPPERSHCDGESWYHSSCLPRELAEGDYLPAAHDAAVPFCRLTDRFNQPFTYKYKAPGWGTHNDAPVAKLVWVPDAFPRDPYDAHGPGQYYDNLTWPCDAQGKVVASPVTWVVWSVGPRCQPGDMYGGAWGPVARESWYRGYGSAGVIPIVRQSTGEWIVHH